MTENSGNYNYGGTDGPSVQIDLDMLGMAHIHGEPNDDGSISIPADELLAHCLRLFKGRLMTLAGVYFAKSEGGK